MDFYEYPLNYYWEKGHVNHTLRIERHSEEGVHSYVHPDGIDGDTPDLIISPDDQVTTLDSEAPTQGLE